jgi:hypothetical protein
MWVCRIKREWYVCMLRFYFCYNPILKSYYISLCGLSSQKQDFSYKYHTSILLDAEWNPSTIRSPNRQGNFSQSYLSLYFFLKKYSGYGISYNTSPVFRYHNLNIVLRQDLQRVKHLCQIYKIVKIIKRLLFRVVSGIE